MERKPPGEWKQNLTAGDQQALAQMPDDWFYPEDVPDLSQPARRCKRLNKMGYLESRVGHGVLGFLQYRKVK